MESLIGIKSANTLKSRAITPNKIGSKDSRRSPAIYSYKYEVDIHRNRYSVSSYNSCSWSVRVATEARVTRRRFSHLRGTSAGGSANPAVRHPRAVRTLFCWDCCLVQDAAVLSTAVYRREFAGPDLPEVPSEGGREQRDHHG
ncbi:hypothetical protein DPMN_058796 [Dreissena polymorpha]|uniref:Uncharacterized protein n=1 Tax=Dreissena polymorpha TaxID=45954 RepID=A0A9D4C2N9_DREPO|nr:hypothetical protein DPMN_058796 [Dreissena polymorpha]